MKSLKTNKRKQKNYQQRNCGHNKLIQVKIDSPLYAGDIILFAGVYNKVKKFTHIWDEEYKEINDN